MDSSCSLRRLTMIAALLPLLLLGGCSRPPADIDGEDNPDFVLGNMLKEFEAPTLDELEAKVAETGGWVDSDVLDSLELLRERQKGEQPIATLEEALALANDSDENNQKIKDALGRLPESNDEVDYEAVISPHTASLKEYESPAGQLHDRILRSRFDFVRIVWL